MLHCTAAISSTLHQRTGKSPWEPLALTEEPTLQRCALKAEGYVAFLWSSRRFPSLELAPNEFQELSGFPELQNSFFLLSVPSAKCKEASSPLRKERFPCELISEMISQEEVSIRSLLLESEAMDPSHVANLQTATGAERELGKKTRELPAQLAFQVAKN